MVKKNLKMKTLIHLLLFFSVPLVFAQESTVITYSESKIVKKEMLTNVPDAMKDFVVAQIQAMKSISTLTFFETKHYYKLIASKKSISKKGNIASDNRGTYKDANGTLIEENILISKNRLKNTYQTYINNVLVSKPLEKASWKVSKETKKILKYNCIKASTTYNKKPLTVYFTTEIKGEASPNKYPFIDGVILEYNDGGRIGIATDVAFNQPHIKKFF